MLRGGGVRLGPQRGRPASGGQGEAGSDPARAPADIQDVFLFTFNTNDIPIVEGRISAKDRDLSDSYDLIQNRVVARLQRIPGVGKVELHGVEPGAISVYLKLNKIKEHNVDVSRMFNELSSSNFNLTVGHVTKDGPALQPEGHGFGVRAWRRSRTSP